MKSSLGAGTLLMLLLPGGGCSEEAPPPASVKHARPAPFLKPTKPPAPAFEEKVQALREVKKSSAATAFGRLDLEALRLEWLDYARSMK